MSGWILLRAGPAQGFTEALDVLRPRVRSSSPEPAVMLVHLLFALDEPDEAIAVARVRMAADSHSTRRLVDVLLSQGHAHDAIAMPHDRIDLGDSDAAEVLVDVLTKLGRANEADRLSRFGLNADGSIASGPVG